MRQPCTFAILRQVAREQRVAVLAPVPREVASIRRQRGGEVVALRGVIGQRHVDREIGGQRRELALAQRLLARSDEIAPFRLGAARLRDAPQFRRLGGSAEQIEQQCPAALGHESVVFPRCLREREDGDARERPGTAGPGLPPCVMAPLLAAALSPKENTGTRNSARAFSAGKPSPRSKSSPTTVLSS